MALQDVIDRHRAKMARWREKNGSWVPYFAPVGASDSERNRRAAHEKKFRDDMMAFDRARKAGLKPDGVSVEAVERLEKRAESIDRLQKMEDRGIVDFQGALPDPTVGDR